MLLWLRLTSLGRRGDEGPPGGVDDAEETEFEAVDGVGVGVPGVFSTDGNAVGRYQCRREGRSLRRQSTREHRTQAPRP